MLRGLAALAAAFILAACAAGHPDPGERAKPGPMAELPPHARSLAEAGPLEPLDEAGRRWVDEMVDSLEVRELAGQLVMPWISGAYAAEGDEELEEALEWARSGAIGGVMFSIGSPHVYAAKANALQEQADVPLLVASDFESGGPGMRVHHAYALPSLHPQGGGTSFPPTMALGATGDPELTRAKARATAREARALGVHVIFAPVLDVNSNPENPIINTRSFGEDPEAVAAHGRAFVKGAREGGALATAKHFPGHGDTGVDSHLELPSVEADRERLDSLELVPFRAAVEAGVPGVMTAHVAMPEVLGEEGPPATLAPEVMTGLLREEMGFDGLLFTDALEMGAILEHFGAEEAAVMAVEAGADVLLVPEDVPATVDAVVEAVEAGRISRERLEASARRVLEAKARMGLPEGSRVDPEALPRHVGHEEHRALADTMAVRSLALARDRDGVLPMEAPGEARVLSVTYAGPEDRVAGAAFDRVLAGYASEVERYRLDRRSGPGEYEVVAEAAEEADAVVVSVYHAPRAGVGDVEIPAELVRLVELVDARVPTVLASFGTPYLLDAVSGVGTYLLAWGDREVSQDAAARAVVGARKISGRLPISIPPHHATGDGLTRRSDPALAALDVPPADALLRRGIEPAPYPEPPEEPTAAAPDAGFDADWRATADGALASRKEVPPQEVGMDPEALAVVDSLLARAVSVDSVSPGAAVVIGRGDRPVRLRGYGRLDWDEDAARVTPATIFDLASLTKVTATTAATLRLVEEGRLSLDDPVAAHLPEWVGGDPAKRAVTVRDLLLHRSGLPAWAPWYSDLRGRDAFLRGLAGISLQAPPGTRTTYSDLGFILLGLLVEEVSGQGLDEFLESELAGPLGLRETFFRPAESLRYRIAPTEVVGDFRNRHLRGEVHDANAFALGGVAGHAGLFSSARDLGRIAAALARGGTLPACEGTVVRRICAGEEPVRIFQESTVAAVSRPYDDRSRRALGWDTRAEGDPNDSDDPGFSPSAFGHTGFTGTSMWVDPERDLYVVLLTSRVNPSRENTRHLDLRREVHRAAVEAVEEMTNRKER